MMDKEDYFNCADSIRLTGRIDFAELALTKAPNHWKEDIATMALEASCRYNSVKTGKFIRKLFQNFPDMDVNMTLTSTAMTPLAWASQVGHVEAVQILLDQGKNICVGGFLMGNKVMGAPLFEACKFGHLEVVEVLLKDERLILHFPSDDGETALDVAKRFGRNDIVNLLLKAQQNHLHLFCECDSGT